MVNSAILSENSSRPDEDFPYFSFSGGYDTILDSIGHQVVVLVSDNDYQGDTHVLLKSGDTYGFLTFGWGSCSGCDALQACNSLDDVIELARGLEHDIHWESSAALMHQYIHDKEWGLDYRWHEANVKEFIVEAITALGGNGQLVLANITKREEAP